MKAVIGAGGPVGRLCVEQLLQAGDSVRAIVRSPDKFKQLGITGEHLQVSRGDVPEPASVEAALEGVDSCIYAAAGATYFCARAVENEVCCTVNLLIA